MQQKRIEPKDIKFTSSGCIICAIENLTDDQHITLAEHVDNIFKSYEEVKGPSQTTTEDGFLEIHFNLKFYKIDRDEFSNKLADAINNLALQN